MTASSRDEAKEHRRESVAAVASAFEGIEASGYPWLLFKSALDSCQTINAVLEAAYVERNQTRITLDFATFERIAGRITSLQETVRQNVAAAESDEYEWALHPTRGAEEEIMPEGRSE